MQRHIMTEIVNHSRSIVLERLVNFQCGVVWGAAKIDIRGLSPRLSFAVVYRRHLFNRHKGFNSSVQHFQEHKKQTNTDMKH